MITFRYLMSWVSKPNKKAVYYFNIYDTELKTLVCRIDRKDELKMNMIYHIKADK